MGDTGEVENIWAINLKKGQEEVKRFGRPFQLASGCGTGRHGAQNTRSREKTEEGNY